MKCYEEDRYFSVAKIERREKWIGIIFIAAPIAIVLVLVLSYIIAALAYLDWINS